MTTQETAPNPITRFQKQKNLLEKVGGISKSGFAQVTDQMGGFSVGFASGVTQAFSAWERLSPRDSHLGIKQLQEDYKRIDQETKSVLQGIGALVEQQTAIQEQLRLSTIWALELEQDALLPAMSEHVRAHFSGELERQTLGSIVDSLMNQIRTLIRDIILSTQESATLIGGTTRRLSADLESSKYQFSILKTRSTTLMKQMTDRVEAMSFRCGTLEAQSAQVSRVMFEMIQEIQFDDITSQRLEHVVTTIDRIVERVTATNKLKNNDKRWTAVATRIVMDQLQDLSSDLEKAVLALRQHLLEIGNMADTRKQTMMATRDDAMLFKENIADLSFLFSALLRLSLFDDNFSMELLRNFSKTENSLFQTKRTFDMLVMTAHRLEKLLDTLECKNNRRLETLSAIIKTLVGRIQNEGGGQAQQLLALTGQLQDVGLSYSEQSTPRIMRVITLLRRVPLRAQQMEADHGDVSAIFNDIISETQAMIVQVNLLVASMDFHDSVKKGAEHASSRFQELLPEIVGKEILEGLEGDLSSQADEFSDLAGLYTMARERKTHGAALGQAEAAEEDGDGFELF